MKNTLQVVVACLCLALVAPLAHASNGHQYDACFTYVGHYYGINPALLRAIAAHESHFNPRAIHSNTNGSVDVGIMQINSTWFGDLARMGVTPERLVTQPCLNIAVGASILHDNIQRLGLTWNAVGAYNAASPAKRERYAAAIAHQLVAELHAGGR